MRRRIRRRRRAPPGSLRALGRCGRVTQTAQPEAAVAVARGLRAGAGSGLWLSEAPRRAELAARRGAMEIGTEISRKIRVRPAGGGGGGKPGLGGRAVVRSNGVVGPAWTPRPGRRLAAPPGAWGLTRPRACGGGPTCRGRKSSCGEAEGGGGGRCEPCSAALGASLGWLLEGSRGRGRGRRRGSGGRGRRPRQGVGGPGASRLPRAPRRAGGACTRTVASALQVGFPRAAVLSRTFVFFPPLLRVPLRGNCKN